MTKEEEKIWFYFTSDEFKRFQQVCGVLQICAPTQIAKDSIAKVYYNSLISAFHAGRVEGMREMKAVSERQATPPQVERASLSVELGPTGPVVKITGGEEPTT